MAYDNTVPDPDNPGLEDVDAMRENFQLLEDSQVVDEGSTEDGDYIRYENGWQICIKKFNLGPITDNDEHSYSENWNYPINFVETPETISSFRSNTASSVLYTGSQPNRHVGGSTNETEVDIMIQIADGQETEVEQYLSAISIGRWK